MPNPFDEESSSFLVLVNDEKQYSLWPAALAVPGGWTVARGEGSRAESLEFVETVWTDMRPAGLVEAMAAEVTG
ncbi:MbtH family NRPS accessory protein [Streptomyces sp. SL13]|uniref:MbtH family NRPS accessory protein n=1 Tax=Streptantibioticus silvisoli TaxID=2705255 RepID=A0AA90GYT1_9ACTN|nr:MbtH family NRPS accessory protein [Streptantibioticus silvisoli]MDI5965408.1 MbtH family NRPS accessory protein [Streptantibioticus silvisoli]MDI5968931.1 MbtH family NRPS accessory protein [Streptantibioticus silvisoli]